MGRLPLDPRPTTLTIPPRQPTSGHSAAANTKRLKASRHEQNRGRSTGLHTGMKPAKRTALVAACQRTLGATIALQTSTILDTNGIAVQSWRSAERDAGVWPTLCMAATGRSDTSAIWIPPSWDWDAECALTLQDITHTMRTHPRSRVTVVCPAAWFTSQTHMQALHTCTPTLLARGHVHGGELDMSIWIVQNTPLHMWEPDWGVVINLLGSEVHRWGLSLCHDNFLTAPAGGPRYQQRYWEQWHREVQIRRNIYNSTGGWDSILDSIGRMNEIITLCPAKWVRELARMTTYTSAADLRRPGTWIYCAYHPMYGLRYWGQTGAQDTIRAVRERFYEEITDAKRWHTTYGKKGVRGPPYIHTLHHTGIEHWQVIPIRQVRPSQADAVEQYHITHKGRNLNSRGSTAHKYMQCLIRSRLYRHLTDTALHDHAMWTRMIQAKRITHDPMDCLTIITAAKKVMAVDQYHMLRGRLLEYVHDRTGLLLPTSLPIRIPYATTHMRRTIQQAWHQFLHTAPYPKPIRKYLAHILTVVSTKPAKAQDVWCEDRIDSSVATIKRQLYIQQPAAHCGCPQKAGAPHTCAHMSLHTADDRVHHFGDEWSPLLCMRLQQSVSPTVHTLHEHAAAQLKRIRDQVPHLRPFNFRIFSTVVHRTVGKGISQTPDRAAPHPANATTALMRRFKRTHTHTLETGAVGQKPGMLYYAV